MVVGGQLGNPSTKAELDVTAESVSMHSKPSGETVGGNFPLEVDARDSDRTQGRRPLDFILRKVASPSTAQGVPLNKFFERAWWNGVYRNGRCMVLLPRRLLHGLNNRTRRQNSRNVWVPVPTSPRTQPRKMCIHITAGATSSNTEVGALLFESGAPPKATTASTIAVNGATGAAYREQAAPSNSTRQGLLLPRRTQRRIPLAKFRGDQRNPARNRQSRWRNQLKKRHRRGPRTSEPQTTCEQGAVPTGSTPEGVSVPRAATSEGDHLSLSGSS